jgi:hypothetical protein
MKNPHRFSRCRRFNPSPLPPGFSDPVLWVGYKGKIYLMLIKPIGEDMTGDEDIFFAGWYGQSSIIHTAKDALNVLGY